MAGEVQVKRSTGNVAPASLLAGELAWAQGSGGTAQGGGLFIGGTDGNVKTIITKAQTDKLDGIAAGAQVNTVNSVAGKTGTITLVAGDITDFNSAADGRIAASSLDALANVNAPTPSNGQVLTFNGTAWVPQASGSGVTTFIALNDTPANYTNKAGSLVRVNAAGNALEFVETLDAGTF